VTQLENEVAWVTVETVNYLVRTAHPYVGQRLTLEVTVTDVGPPEDGEVRVTTRVDDAEVRS
jgi:hypothetical protein